MNCRASGGNPPIPIDGCGDLSLPFLGFAIHGCIFCGLGLRADDGRTVRYSISRESRKGKRGNSVRQKRETDNASKYLSRARNFRSCRAMGMVHGRIRYASGVLQRLYSQGCVNSLKDRRQDLAQGDGTFVGQCANFILSAFLISLLCHFLSLWQGNMARERCGDDNFQKGCRISMIFRTVAGCRPYAMQR